LIFILLGFLLQPSPPTGKIRHLLYALLFAALITFIPGLPGHGLSNVFNPIALMWAPNGLALLVAIFCNWNYAHPRSIHF